MLIVNLTKVNLLKGQQTEFLSNGKITFKQETFLKCAEKSSMWKWWGWESLQAPPRHPHLQLSHQKAKDPSNTEAAKSLPAREPIGPPVS